MYESPSSPARLYLDKIMTLPTLPRKSNDEYAGPFIPNLEHTGIQSSFAPRIKTALMPNGSLNRKSVVDAIHVSRDASRKLIEIKATTPSYQKYYKHNLDRRLVQLEESHISNQRSITDILQPVKVQSKTLHQKDEIRATLKTAHVPVGRTRKIHNKETVLGYLINELGNDDLPYDEYQNTSANQETLTSASQSQDESSMAMTPVVTNSIASRTNSPPRRFGSISKPLSPSRLNSPPCNDDLYGADWDAGSFDSYTQKSVRSSGGKSTKSKS